MSSSLQVSLSPNSHGGVEETRFLIERPFDRPHQSVGATFPSARSGICLDRGRVSCIRGHSIPEPIEAQGSAYENFTRLDRICQFKNGNDLQLAAVERMRPAIPY